jgi:hypothetical protein
MINGVDVVAKPVRLLVGRCGSRPRHLPPPNFDRMREIALSYGCELLA